MSRERLIACGFEIAGVAFVGTAGRDLYFAARRCDNESHVKHYFTIYFANGTVTRSSCRGAQHAVWSIDEACREFAPAALNRMAPFVDRLRSIGFVLQPSTDRVSEKYKLNNFWCSRGDGSRWFAASSGEKLIRFDVSPWQIFRCDGLQLVECSNADEKLQPVEQIAQSPMKPPKRERSTVGVSRPELEHSGANQQGDLF